MENRKQPFGYHMEMGEVVITPIEADTVREIFTSYIAGTSLKGISDNLNAGEVSYRSEKSWNKNMVARILEDERYTGANGYSALIDGEVFLAAARIRCSKQIANQPTQAQKALRRLANAKITEKAESQVLAILNRLIKSPELLIAPDTIPDMMEIKRLKNEFDNITETYPVDETAAKETVLALASARYAAISDAEYETERLRRIFERTDLLIELNAELIQSTVSAVTVHRDGSITVELKNHQIIGKSEVM